MLQEGFCKNLCFQIGNRASLKKVIIPIILLKMEWFL